VATYEDAERWVDSNIYPYQYDSKKEFENEIQKHIPDYAKFPKVVKEDIWEGYQIQERTVAKGQEIVEEAEQELEERGYSENIIVSKLKAIAKKISKFFRRG
jgi:glycerate-2-kinase